MKHYDLLIVDDEQRYADMLARRLGLRRLNCKVCYDGRTAIEIIEGEPFPVVILDLRLPDIYGTEVLTDGKWIEIGKELTQVYGHRDALGNCGNSWVSATTAGVEHWVVDKRLEVGACLLRREADPAQHGILPARLVQIGAADREDALGLVGLADAVAPLAAFLDDDEAFGVELARQTLTLRLETIAFAARSIETTSGGPDARTPIGST